MPRKPRITDGTTFISAILIAGIVFLVLRLLFFDLTDTPRLWFMIDVVEPVFTFCFHLADWVTHLMKGN